MPFPQIISADTQTGTQVTSVTTWTLTYPTNLVAGDLVLGFVAINADATGGTFPATWLGGAQGSSGGACRLYSGKKKSLGTETGTFSVGTFSIACQGAWITLRIAPWDGNLGSGSFGGTGADGAVSIPAAFGTTGTSTTPTQNANNPVSWDVDDTLWLGIVSATGPTAFTGFPSNMPDNQQSVVPGSGTGNSLGLATAASTVASFAGTSFTLASSVLWCATQIAVRPISPTVGPYLYPARHFGPF